jgi:hypothetical protein
VEISHLAGLRRQSSRPARCKRSGWPS